MLLIFWCQIDNEVNAYEYQARQKIDHLDTPHPYILTLATLAQILTTTSCKEMLHEYSYTATGLGAGQTR